MMDIPIKERPPEPNWKEGDVLTKADVARYRKVSTQTIDNWTRNGLIPEPNRTGRTVRWRFEDIELKLS